MRGAIKRTEKKTGRLIMWNKLIKEHSSGKVAVPFYLREEPAPSKLDEKGEKILSIIGGSEWIKEGMHRIYFDAKTLANLFGLTFDSYKSGSVKNATLDGDSISNSKATYLVGCLDRNFWYDSKEHTFSHKISCRDFDAEEIAGRIIKAIEAKIA